jgi:hypothetical protein
MFVQVCNEEGGFGREEDLNGRELSRITFFIEVWLSLII